MLAAWSVRWHYCHRDHLWSSSSLASWAVLNTFVGWWLVRGLYYPSYIGDHNTPMEGSQYGFSLVNMVGMEGPRVWRDIFLGHQWLTLNGSIDHPEETRFNRSRVAPNSCHHALRFGWSQLSFESGSRLERSTTSKTCKKKTMLEFSSKDGSVAPFRISMPLCVNHWPHVAKLEIGLFKQCDVLYFSK